MKKTLFFIILLCLFNSCITFKEYRNEKAEYLAMEILRNPDSILNLKENYPEYIDDSFFLGLYENPKYVDILREYIKSNLDYQKNNFFDFYASCDPSNFMFRQFYKKIDSLYKIDKGTENNPRMFDYVICESENKKCLSLGFVQIDGRLTLISISKSTYDY